LRLSEKWYKRGLWWSRSCSRASSSGWAAPSWTTCPKVETRKKLDDFMDAAATARLRATIKDSRAAEKAAQEALAQARWRQNVALSDNRGATEIFNNWLATRRATERPDQDRELIERTARLEQLRKAQREAETAVEAQQQATLDARQAADRAHAQLSELENGARESLEKAQRAQELRVFLYRLALTLPLLAVAGWLFAKKRGSPWWPFVWGFILFAVFTFFVELVPYLPSYGGTCAIPWESSSRHSSGGRPSSALNRYLEEQKKAEAMPDARRRERVGYDVALARLAKNVCPGCERPWDLKNEANDFCPHCGIGLHDRCGKCNARKNAFARFCHSCGTAAAGRGAA